MPMPMTAVMMGMLLGLLGIAGAISSHMHGGNMKTALIPLYFGIPFILLGAGALAKPSLRKHLMHLLAIIALLGVIMPIVSAAIRWSQMKPMGRISVAGMAIICALTLFFCVRSFINARKARQAGTAV